MAILRPLGSWNCYLEAHILLEEDVVPSHGRKMHPIYSTLILYRLHLMERSVSPSVLGDEDAEDAEFLLLPGGSEQLYTPVVGSDGSHSLKRSFLLSKSLKRKPTPHYRIMKNSLPPGRRHSLLSFKWVPEQVFLWNRLVPLCS